MAAATALAWSWTAQLLGVEGVGKTGQGVIMCCLPVMAVPISTVKSECMKPGRQALVMSKQRNTEAANPVHWKYLGHCSRTWRGGRCICVLRCSCAALLVLRAGMPIARPAHRMCNSKL